MRRTLPATWLLALALAMPACTHFDYVVGEFDSATNLSLQRGEPEKLAYQDQPKRWPWMIRSLGGSGLDWAIAWLFGIEPSPQSVDNPSGYVRERLMVLADQATGDLVMTAHAASRLLWIAEEDQVHALNQVTAIARVARMMKDLGLDPLHRPPPDDDSTRSRAEYLADRRLLAAAWPSRRPDGLSAEQRQAYLSALFRLTEKPTAEGRQGRDLLRDLAYRVVLEGDAELRSATELALRESLANEFAQGIHRGLRSTSPEVREAATLALYELSGPQAVPFCLAVLHDRSRSGVEFDPSPELRRTLIRICGQLRGEVLYQTAAMASGQEGPMPIRYLYETARDDREEGLRSIALEAMALSLGRPIDFDQDWADEWWRGFLANGVGLGR